VGVVFATHYPPHEPIIFIDDRLDQCQSVKAHIPEAHCFLIVRYKVCLPDVPSDITPVYSLAEVDAIMKSFV
jgi:hypothetical protein